MVVKAGHGIQWPDPEGGTSYGGNGAGLLYSTDGNSYYHVGGGGSSDPIVVITPQTGVHKGGGACGSISLTPWLGGEVRKW